MAYLGWFVAGVVLGWLLGMRSQRQRLTLQQRSASVTTFSGRSFREIIALLERLPASRAPLPQGRVLYTWREQEYELRLMFDAGNICLGVYDERLGS